MVIVMLIVTCALGTVLKGLERGLEELEIEGQIESIQTTKLLRSAKIFSRVQETGGDLLSLRFQ